MLARLILGIDVGWSGMHMTMMIGMYSAIVLVLSGWVQQRKDVRKRDEKWMMETDIMRWLWVGIGAVAHLSVSFVLHEMQQRVMAWMEGRDVGSMAVATIVAWMKHQVDVHEQVSQRNYIRVDHRSWCIASYRWHGIG